MRTSGSPLTGYVLTAKVRSQEKMQGVSKAYDYAKPQWQVFASACVLQHVTNTILNSVPVTDRDEAFGKIRLEPLSQHALYPLRTQVRTQSASGIEVHILVSGVLFEATEDDAADGLGLVRCPPIPMMGEVPSGRVSEGGTKPLTCKGQMYFSMRDLTSKPKIRNGYFFCPAALETVPGHEDWEEAKRSQRRSQQRKAGKARRAPSGEPGASGDESDDSRASSMRKLARTASNQLGISLRPQGPPGQWGQSWGGGSSSSRG